MLLPIADLPLQISANLLHCNLVAIGPERRLLPAPTWSRLGAKQTPLEVARMTRLTHSDISRLAIAALRKDYSITVGR
jgi:hypothetical protein